MAPGHPAMDDPTDAAWTTPPGHASPGRDPRAQARRRQSAGLPRLDHPVPDGRGLARPQQAAPAASTYGRYGTPTTFALEEAVAALEGGDRAIVRRLRRAAAITAIAAGLRSKPATISWWSTRVYGPTRSFCDRHARHASASRPPIYDPADRRRHRRADPAQHPAGLSRDARARSPSRCRTCRRSPRPPRRAAASIADRQHLGDAALLQAVRRSASTSRSTPRPSTSAAIPT